MIRLLKIVFFTNVFASLAVFILSRYVVFFATTHLIDFLFFVVIIIWILAKLTWEGGMHSKTYDIDDRISSRVQSMATEHDFKSEKHEHYRQNYQLGLVLFIAGTPAFIACFILQWLS
ncbi:MAG: hypothetical protein ACI808_000229 [Paraglaciecola sp.]|jgi:hypothetical protein